MILPECITHMDVEREAAMERSWVMRSIEMPFSLTAFPRSASIEACTVASSAVVGSSATSNAGSIEVAIPIMIR